MTNENDTRPITEEEEREGRSLAAALLTVVNDFDHRAPCGHRVTRLVGIVELGVQFCLNQPDPPAALEEMYRLARDVLRSARRTRWCGPMRRYDQR